MHKLAVDDLKLAYGAVEILKGVSFTLKQGEVVVLLGPSGSGKTTLLRAIAGFETPRSGTIEIDGVQVLAEGGRINQPPEKRNLGMVFQSYALWPHRTVFDNIAYGLRLRGVSSIDTERKVSTAADTLGLSSLLKRYPSELSGGQQQRVALARALVYGAPVVLMDEPLSNLDAQLREEAKAWLKGVIVDLNLSAVIVTHDQAEAMAIGDRVVLLSNGKIEQEGRPIDVYNKPSTFISAAFFGSNNVIEGIAGGTTDGNFAIVTDGVAIRGQNRGKPIEAGAACRAIVRSENIEIRPSSSDGMKFRRIASMYLGVHWQHLFRREGLEMRVYSKSALPDDECVLGFKPEDVWIYAKDGTGAG